MPRRVVLISDLPQGSRLEALGDFEWPSDVELDLKTVADDGSNAGLRAARRLRRGRTRPEPIPRRRVRVFNDPGSRREKFELLWIDEQRSQPPASRSTSTSRRARAASCACPGRQRVRVAPIAPAEGRRARDSTTRCTSRTNDARRGDRPLHRHRSRRRSRRPALLPRARLRRHVPRQCRSHRRSASDQGRSA